MEITGNEGIFKQLAARESGRAEKPARGAFNALLHQVSRADSDDAGKPRPLQAPGSIKGTFFNPLLDVDATSVPDRIENFLNLLESYRDMLADPGVSLKEIGPVMEALSSEKNTLQQFLGTLPKAGELRNILNEALVAASLEEVKFNKGDYSPA